MLKLLWNSYLEILICNSEGIVFSNHVDRIADDRLLIFTAQLQLVRWIARAKTDVPIFNQIFVLCLVFSGRIDHF